MSQQINPNRNLKTDEEHLSFCLQVLKERRELEYSGEYGAEITTFIPFVAWLKAQGHLKGCRIKTYVGMRPYYFFLDDDEYEEKSDLRRWLPIPERYWPSNSTYHAVQSPYHYYHDFRAHYGRKANPFNRPIVFMQNKFNIEWEAGPINFMPLMGLYQFFEATKDQFTIVYSRPGSRNNQNFSKDHNFELNYPDLNILSDYPHAIHFESYCADNALDYNTTKLELMARSRLYIAVQGGGAHLMACFSGSIMLVLDRSENLSPGGMEYPHAYQSGPYKYLASPPANLMVARNFPEFYDGLALMSQVQIDEGQFRLPEAMKSTFQRLSI
jgi:hypothetical protein